MTPLPIPTDVGDLIRYEPDTGMFFWRVDCGPMRKAGDVAGSLNNAGYWRIMIRNSTYGGHRVAWFLMTGEQPPTVDHADGDRANNRWSNLRSASHSQNSANRKPRGAFAKGVTLHRTGRYQAQIKCAGKNHYLGLFDTEVEAASAYAAKATELFGEFARAAA